MSTTAEKNDGSGAAVRSETAPLLTVDDVSTRFRTPRGWLHAVEGVSLTLEKGETLGLVGESGSGKSVLGKTIMGLISADTATHIDGTITFDGHDMQKLSRKQQRRLWGNDIAMIFQDPMTALNPLKHIGTQLTESIRAHMGLGKEAARERAVDLLRKVRIPEPERRVGQYPHEMSGGMRQRVVIAIALACDPTLTIADEPTTALDVTVQKQILELLDDLRHDLGMAGILVSHDLGVVAGQADRVAVMYAGKIVETAPTRQLFAAPRHPYTTALLAAIPHLSAPPHSRLEAIEGGLPDMTTPPEGCPFAPRCRYAQQRCLDQMPPLREIRLGAHAAAGGGPGADGTDGPAASGGAHRVPDPGGDAGPVTGGAGAEVTGADGAGADGAGADGAGADGAGADPKHTHQVACFYPVGTPEGHEALAANEKAGRTAAGRELKLEAV